MTGKGSNISFLSLVALIFSIAAFTIAILSYNKTTAINQTIRTGSDHDRQVSVSDRVLHEDSADSSANTGAAEQDKVREMIQQIRDAQ